jgi:peptidoglycan/xylan/chitin deacetylase (PgdA/CDA1 family)
MWKNSKKWVYSITYDEGCQDLLKHALAIHRKFGIPGHVALVASQIGVARDVPGSTYDGMMVLSKDQIHMLKKEGWGVSCHSMTHAAFTPENEVREVIESRKVLEHAIDLPVKMFCVPGDNNNYPAALRLTKSAGYNSILTIYDNINEKSTDLFRLCRCPLHSEYPPPFYSAFDPYKRIQQAADRGGWIIDYCHCPMPGKPLHPWKDCTVEELERRFKSIVDIGGDDVWLAEPNEVVDFMLK